MADPKTIAAQLLRDFKADAYVFGPGCLDQVGRLAADLGRRATVICGGEGKPWGDALREAARRSLTAAGVSPAGPLLRGASPNSPREDVARLAAALRDQRPDVVVAVGGGSVLDAVKAAIVLATLGDLEPDLEAYYGVGRVTERLRASGRRLTPMLAVQTASASAAHLTKYANITNLTTAQKKLIIDEAVTPPRALFDYALTRSMSREFTADGAMDGLSHCIEVFCGARGASYERIRTVALAGIELILSGLAPACRDGADAAAREALGLGTDLGGYAIMLGSTSGGHLVSFSLVDLLPHGRACALMNPYFAVLFAPALSPQLRDLADLYARAGHFRGDARRLRGRDLGLAVAEAMQRLARSVGFPTTLAEAPGFSDAHVTRILEAAKNPQLESKLRAMPVPLDASQVDAVLGPVLEAARTGDFARIPELKGPAA